LLKDIALWLLIVGHMGKLCQMAGGIFYTT